MKIAPWQWQLQVQQVTTGLEASEVAPTEVVERPPGLGAEKGRSGCVNLWCSDLFLL